MPKLKIVFDADDLKVVLAANVREVMGLDVDPESIQIHAHEVDDDKMDVLITFDAPDGSCPKVAEEEV